MPDKSDVPTLDLSAISFPTDSVSIGKMRCLKPEHFESLSETNLFDLGLTGAMDIEITLAEKAFLKELGVPDPNDESRGELVEMLNQDYCAWGLSAGLNETRQRVRAFEAVAREQARAIQGRGR